jgi:putative acetyltransferase
VRAGLDECRRLGAGAVIVLGHAEFYPRFGFTPASRVGLASEYDVPDNVFMALELEDGVLRGKTGTIRYHPAFASA